MNIYHVDISTLPTFTSAYNNPFVFKPANIVVELKENLETREEIENFVRACDLHCTLPAFIESTSGPPSPSEPGVYDYDSSGIVSYYSLPAQYTQTLHEEQKVKAGLNNAAVHVNEGRPLPNYQEISEAFSSRQSAIALYEKYT